MSVLLFPDNTVNLTFQGIPAVQALKLIRGLK